MIAWMIIDFGLYVWIENKLADISRNYCDLKCIFGHTSIYKGGAAEIFKDLEMIMIICRFK